MGILYTNTTENLVLADIRKRLLAFIIDILVLGAVIELINYYTISSDESSLILKPEGIIYILIGWVYFAGTETCSHISTLGKYLMQIKVKSTEDSPLSFKSASIRYFTKPVSIVILFFRFIKGLPTDTCILYHDKAAHALVVPDKFISEV